VIVVSVLVCHYAWAWMWPASRFPDRHQLAALNLLMITQLGGLIDVSSGGGHGF